MPKQRKTGKEGSGMQRMTLIFLLLCSCAVNEGKESTCPADDLVKACNVELVSDEERTERKFYAFDNGLTGIKSFEEKAAVLKELGYDGICWRPGAGLDEMLKALDKHGLRMLSTYVGCKVDADNPSFDERLAGEIEGYKKHKTIIWLHLTRGKKANDEIAVKLINEVAELADTAGLKVVLYPHAGFYVETVEDALRLTKKVNRPNVGMSFNLCHFLKTDDEKNLEAVLKKAAPHLVLVSVNGADSGDTKTMSWDRLIRPLGDGTYDTGKVLKVLDEIGYTGPIGLQCYSIKGDDRVNLKKSIEAYRVRNTSPRFTESW
jgi:sugar phosphate isomerase/epimerase